MNNFVYFSIVILIFVGISGCGSPEQSEPNPTQKEQFESESKTERDELNRHPENGNHPKHPGYE